MIRFAWLQSRTQTAVAAATMLAVAVLLAATGPHLLHLYHLHLASCASPDECLADAVSFQRTYRPLQDALNALVVVVPALTGLFWGAPLAASEFENGTFRLAWTQSVTRTRWLGTRLAVAGLASMAVAGLVSLMVTWWSSPLDKASTTQFASFDYRDIVPVGYAAFALALGVTAGLVWRMTLPAMASTLVLFVAAREAFVKLVRPGLISPLVRNLPLNPRSTGYGMQGTVFSLLGGSHGSTLEPSPPSIAGAWITSVRVVDRNGGGLTNSFLSRTCPTLGKHAGGPGPGFAGGPGAGSSAQKAPPAVVQELQSCVSRVGRTFHESVLYQPASRYWELQWIELAVFTGAAAALAAFCLWWVRRDVA